MGCRWGAGVHVLPAGPVQGALTPLPWRNIVLCCCHQPPNWFCCPVGTHNPMPCTLPLRSRCHSAALPARCSQGGGSLPPGVPGAGTGNSAEVGCRVLLPGICCWAMSCRCCPHMFWQLRQPRACCFPRKQHSQRHTCFARPPTCVAFSPLCRAAAPAGAARPAGGGSGLERSLP